jgi:two-component system nitrogen regulation sensor histidine kinase NtrY
MTHNPDNKKRRTRSFALLIILFLAVLTAVELLFQQLNNPVPIINNLIVFTLVNVNIILLVVLILVVVRNLANFISSAKTTFLAQSFRRN